MEYYHHRYMVEVSNLYIVARTMSSLYSNHQSLYYNPITNILLTIPPYGITICYLQ